MIITGVYPVCQWKLYNSYLHVRRIFSAVYRRTKFRELFHHITCIIGSFDTCSEKLSALLRWFHTSSTYAVRFPTLFAPIQYRTRCRGTSSPTERLLLLFCMRITRVWFALVSSYSCPLDHVVPWDRNFNMQLDSSTISLIDCIRIVVSADSALFDVWNCSHKRYLWMFFESISFRG